MSTQSLLLDLPPLTAAIDRYPFQLQGSVDLLTAIKLMDRSPQGKYVLVVTDGLFLGIFTDRDVVKAIASGRDLPTTTLAEILPAQSITLVMDEEQTLLSALELLSRHQLTYLPILTPAGDAIGVVTQTTLLQTLHRIEECPAAETLSHIQIEQEVTERCKIEASLRRTTNEQQEQHFLRAQRLEILGTLASGIAHDMNNILTPILAASQLLPLAIPHLDKRSKRLIAMLEESAHRGSDLVQQILAFAQGTESRHRLIEIVPLLTAVLSVARQAFPSSIEVVEDFIDQPLRLVTADHTQIHQVLMNLLVNARDAMPHGGRLSISARNRDFGAGSQLDLAVRDGSYVLVTVSDSGVGIPPEHLEKIFDPFFTTKGVDRGTGLGLSTAISILKNHGGFLLVDSEVGRGSEFQVFLPCEA